MDGRALFKVRTLKNVMIPMRDGTKLAADIFLPEGQGKSPVVLEAYPYRKDDYVASIASIHHYFAQRGIAGVLLDIRGSGASEGFVTDEYLPIEQQDEYDTIEWLAKQEWSNGKIGMWGSSYGAENSLQVAMVQPPSLKAIAPMFGTDDRYEDFYTGGAKQTTWTSLYYGPGMVSLNALPPYPAYSGADWLRIWEEHLEKNTPWLLEWLDRQTDGPYWQRPLGRQYNKVKCPTFIIAGWTDFYATMMPRLYANLKVPKKLLIGPWPHMRPDTSTPGPRIDYARELVRWFRYWLNDEQTGIMDEPLVTVYVQKYSPPGRKRDITAGFWRNESEWPPKRTKEVAMFLGASGKLKTSPQGSNASNSDQFEYTPVVGATGAFGYVDLMSDDQRPDDALSLVYETEPLDEDVEILGTPNAILFASSTAEVAFFVTRLCDVSQAGVSVLVTKGVLNATRRESMEHPRPLESGKVYELNIGLNPTSWVFEKGHRIRLAISGSNFPELWPSPYKATNTIYRGTSKSSRVILPTVPEQNPKLPPPKFDPPPTYTLTVEDVGLEEEWKVADDLTKSTFGILGKHTGRTRLLDGVGTLTVYNNVSGRVSLIDFGDVSFCSDTRKVVETKGMKVETIARTLTESTRDAFHCIIDLEVRLDGALHFSRRWTKTAARNLL